MTLPKTTIEVPVYEIDGGEERLAKPVYVESHSLDGQKVVLRVGQHTYTVVASTLACALRNASE